MASVLILEKVGAIVNNVRKSASPITAMFGGIVWVVSALRTNDRTITILVKDVIIIKRDGRTASPAKIITSFTGVDQSFPSVSTVAVLSISFIKSVTEGRLSESSCAYAVNAEVVSIVINTKIFKYLQYISGNLIVILDYFSEFGDIFICTAD